MSWDKEQVMVKLDEKIQDGLVDDRFLPVIKLINSHPDYYTTSCCSGRVQVIELPKIGDKERSTVLGKWHEPVSYEKVRSELDNWTGEGVVYLLAQSPIIHIVCKTMSAASQLRNLADAAGFKYSSIRSIKEQRARSSDTEFEKITVEILSTERMDVPVAGDGRVFPDKEYLEFIIDNANSCLERAHDKSKALLENLKANL